MLNVPSVASLQQKLPQVHNLEFQAQGGFKAVYKGDIAAKTEAIKAIYIPPKSEDESNRDELIARIRREIKSLTKCKSDFIVQLGSLPPEIYEINGYDYLIYSEEFLEGESLRSRIKQGYRPDFTDGQQLTTCLFSAIQVLKDNGIIHRDIKPDNIMTLSDSARPFVMLDLGIAYKPQGTPLTANPDLRHGTLPYMAPEMFTPRFRATFDFRSDLYSAGVTIYEYMAAKHPIASVHP